MKLFNYGRYENCYFRAGYYANGNLAIEIINDDYGPVTRVTVNPDITVPYPLIAIKNYSENEGMVEWLVDEGIVEENPIHIVESGWVEIPLHRLTDHGIQLLDL